MKKLIATLVLLSSLSSYSQEIIGKWTGILEVPSGKLTLVFNIAKTENGYSASMDSPNQGAKGIPIEKVSFDTSKKLFLEIPAAKITYSGTLDTTDIIVGNFKQSGAIFPLNLIREEANKRPQEPKMPYSYYSEEVTFQNKIENFSLTGTLTLPKKEGQFPVVVLISGSGAQNRDSELLGHKPFLVIADYLTKNGIGVLRYDDRGVATSKGDRTNATSKNFADDAKAAVDYLKTRKEVNTKKIGLIGHSEGGTIAPMVAANNKDISYIVLLAGTGIPGDDLLIQQAYLIGKSAGMSDTELENARKINKEIYQIIKTEKDKNQIKMQIATILEKQLNELPENQKPTKEQIKSTAAEQSNAIASPWFSYFIKYDPRPILKDVKCAVLVLNGEKDIQVPAKSNTEAIKSELEKWGNKKVTVNIFPGLNHLFQECKTCTIEEYEQIEQTFSPIALQKISEWIGLQTKS